LRTLLRLNTLVGPGEQFLTITNKSVIVMTTNKPAGSASRTSSASSQSAGSWWAERLGTRFVRNSPSNQAENQPNPKAARLIARPLDLSPAPR
jgi:hypothetical protein